MSKENSGKKKSSIFSKIIKWALSIILIFIVVSGYFAYTYIFKPNIDTGQLDYAYLHIPTGSTYKDAKDILRNKNFVVNWTTFTWVAERKNYPNNVRPGRYRIESGMSNNEFVNLLRSGAQEPINLTFSNIRTKEQLAGHISKRIEADSIEIISLLNNEVVLQRYGLSKETAALLFLPNTYEMFWNTSAEQLLKRMHNEYSRFWNDNRLQKAKSMNMTPVEVGILASIVQQETTKTDEMHKIAGVFINRIRRGMPLQADPTVVFAHGDFSIRRVLNKHKEIDSPYNTYRYRGLPPGPISLPSPVAIDHVLNYDNHDYLYFCAKDDFSGYHTFARTLQQHLINARRYQQELNRRNIMR